MNNTTTGQPNNRLLGLLRPWMHYRYKRFWLLFVFAAYNLAGFLLLPWVATSQGEKWVNENLGLRLSATAVRFNPWTLQAEIDELAIHDRASDALLLGFDEAIVNLEIASVWRFGVILQEVTILGPAGEIIIDGQGDLNLLALLPPASAGAAAEGDALQSSETDDANSTIPWSISQLTVSGAQFSFEDQTRPLGFETALGPLDIHIEDLSNFPEQRGNHDVSLSIGSDVVLQWKGSIGLAPLSSSGLLQINGAVPQLALSYVQDLVNLSIVSAELDFSLPYELTLLDDDLLLTTSDSHIGLSNVAIEKTTEGSRSNEDLLSIEEFLVSGIALNFQEKSLQIASLELDTTQVDLIRYGNHEINVLGLLNPVADTATATPNNNTPQTLSESEQSPWLIQLDELTVQQLSVNFSDESLSRPAAMRIENFQVNSNGLSSAPGSVVPFAAEFDLVGGGQVAASGAITLLPQLQGELELSLDNLELNQAQPWLSELAYVELNSGAINLESALRFENTDTASADQALTVQGNFSLQDFAVSDSRNQQRLLAVQQLTLDQYEFDLSENRLDLSQIDIQSPFLRLHIAEDQSTNFNGLMVAAQTSVNEEDNPEPETTEASQLAFSVAAINLFDARSDFSDLALPLPFEANINDLGGSINGLSSKSAEAASVNLSGAVDEFGLVEIGGSVQALDPTQKTDITVSFRNVDMPSLTPYTIRFVGQEIEQGKLDIDLAYRIDANALEAENKVVIRDIKLGDKVEHPTALNLPLGLAVGLLKGPDGTIDLELPITGSLDDPEFKISGIILQTFGNLITRAVAAPFNFLGRLVGADAEDIDKIEFRPGQAELTPPQLEKLNKVAEALGLRPELNLNISGGVNQQIDGPALQQVLFQQQLSNGLAALPPAQQDLLLNERRRIVMEEMYRRASNQAVTTEIGELLDLSDIQAQHQITLSPTDVEANPNPQSPNSNSDTGVTREELDEPAYLARLRELLTGLIAVDSETFATLAKARAETLQSTMLATNQIESNRLIVAAFDQVETADVAVAENGWVILQLDLSSR